MNAALRTKLWLLSSVAAGLVSSDRCFVRSSLVMSTGQTSSGYHAGMLSVAYVTAPNDQVARTIARGLVSKGLAACVNIVPQVTSIYEWKGEIHEDTEVLMMIKTRSSRIEELSKFVRDNHPYEVCEVISTPIADGNPPYLRWLGDSVQPKQETLDF